MTARPGSVFPLAVKAEDRRELDCLASQPTSPQVLAVPFHVGFIMLHLFYL